MTALELLRRHFGLDWKKMGREKLKVHLQERLQVIGEEQKKLCSKAGVSSVDDLEKVFMMGRFRGKEAASLMHQYTRMCSLVRLAEEAMEEMEAPDPDAIEDEFEGYRRH